MQLGTREAFDRVDVSGIAHELAGIERQLVPFELDAAGVLVTVTATNAVEMMFGAF